MRSNHNQRYLYEESYVLKESHDHESGRSAQTGHLLIQKANEFKSSL